MNSVSINDLYNINATIIDIRDNNKYNISHIPGAINIEYNELLINYSKYLNTRNIYVIYCDKGRTSYSLAIYLNGKNYNVLNLLGGYESFKKNNI